MALQFLKPWTPKSANIIFVGNICGKVRFFTSLLNLNLEHKYALVCGSTQGIGKAAAIALASEGVIVTLIARNESKLKEVIKQLPNAENHDYVVADYES